MHKLVSSTGIILLALLVSGWSSVLAAALCPHAGMKQTLAAAEVHSCHSAKTETTDKHQDSQHEGIHGLQLKPVAVSEFHGDGLAAFGHPAEDCAHCIGQSELPAALACARELTLQKRDAGGLIVNKISPAELPATAVSVSRFVPSQHAPPWLAARKQIILGVFLI